MPSSTFGWPSALSFIPTPSHLVPRLEQHLGSTLTEIFVAIDCIHSLRCLTVNHSQSWRPEDAVVFGRRRLDAPF
jgi:hypothetical protein